MKKRTGTVLMALMLVFSILFSVGCSNKPINKEETSSTKQTEDKGKKEKIKIAVLKGPTGMGMVKLMEENKEDYDITIFDSPDQIVSKIVNKEIDAAAVPSNLASVLYNKTKGGVKLVGINTLGILHIVENGDTIKSVKDLKGKTVYASGKGSAPEFIFNYILKKNGLEPSKDVKIEYKMQHNDLATAVASKKVNIAVLPEPFVTTTKMKNKDLNIQLDLTKEWDKISDTKSKLVMGTLIYRKDFIDKRGKDVDEFLDRYKKSVDFVNSNKAEAGKMIEKNGILPKAAIAEKAIPKCNIIFISAEDGKDSLEKFYNVLKESDPKSVGGKIPDENFYYKSNKTN
ncbi:ABC transporter substrate-binding protein [Clostridium sp. MB40-C1]|uniref:ABC transporter substrate-binding protein n=1 Tax=Clostridium sp. MB40-C1 TaxID=3070996 RepID=UPI0027DFE30E|nr:ABC transporter substrate-binding protein [Clostridium sp. MB40-C1]WMJ82046.1 ABC transporter substrate-binding protein [Clostridium sp. MB40-C1]